jgi:hypothetical protein
MSPLPPVTRIRPLESSTDPVADSTDVYAGHLDTFPYLGVPHSGFSVPVARSG